MRDIRRIKETLAVIEEIWTKYPDLRLGQLIGNVVDKDYLYYIEESDLIQALREGYAAIERQDSTHNRIY